MNRTEHANLGVIGRAGPVEGADSLVQRPVRLSNAISQGISRSNSLETHRLSHRRAGMDDSRQIPAYARLRDLTPSDFP